MEGKLERMLNEINDLCKIYPWLRESNRECRWKSLVYHCWQEPWQAQTQSVLELDISGWHYNHCFWLLKQLHSAIPKNLRRNARVLLVWHFKERSDIRMIWCLNHFLNEMWWKNNNNFRLIQVFYQNILMTCFRYVSAYYQVMFNTGKQFLF